jgi:hypothetical protein
VKGPSSKLYLLPASAGFFFGLLFDPEVGGDMFPKKHQAFSKLYSVTSQKTALFIYIYTHL